MPGGEYAYWRGSGAKRGGEKRLERQGVSRRDFMKFCTAVAVAMGMGPAFSEEVAAALTGKAPQCCLFAHGRMHGLFRSNDAHVQALYEQSHSGHRFRLITRETIMAAAGHAAEEALEQAGKFAQWFHLHGGRGYSHCPGWQVWLCWRQDHV